MEATCFSEILVNFSGLLGVIAQKMDRTLCAVSRIVLRTWFSGNGFTFIYVLVQSLVQS
jgi:hypothetical protein